MSLRILNNIGSEFFSQAKTVLDSVGNVDYMIPSQSDLGSIISDYDIVVCGLANTFTAEILQKANRLKVIATVTTGLDHIDINTAKKKGIKVISLHGESIFLNKISGTAELALGLMIMLSRNIHGAYKSVIRGEWRREDYCGHSVRGSTLGILGLGRLGKMMARYGSALGMKVIYHDPHVKASKKDWKWVTFNELLSKSDFVSIHIHLSPETEYLFNTKNLNRMKHGSFLINTSRGKIVDELAIIDLLEKGTLAGYAADVLDGETSFIDHDCALHPLVKYAKNNSNVIVVPHIGGMTYESRRDTDLFIAKKLVRFLKKNSPRFVGGDLL